MATKRKRGRPTVRSPELATEIIDWISKGLTLRDFCRQEGKPGVQTITDWKRDDEEFFVLFTRARLAGADVIAEDCLAIADDGTNDWMEVEGKDSPGWKLNGEHVQRSKLRIETRLKLLAKWFPQHYGERQVIEHEGKLTLSQLVEQSYTAKPAENADLVDDG